MGPFLSSVLSFALIFSFCLELPFKTIKKLTSFSRGGCFLRDDLSCLLAALDATVTCSMLCDGKVGGGDSKGFCRNSGNLWPGVDCGALECWVFTQLSSRTNFRIRSA